MSCRLCLSGNLIPVKGADKREYFLCANCKLISVDPKFFLEEDREKERYLEHNNSIEQAGYVQFLNRAVTPALSFINKDMVGLDYGCGYSATLSEMLKEQGYICENYDPFFFENELNKKYDFIFCIETFEHFFYPRKDISKISSLLKDSGILIVMTDLWKSLEQFARWHYTRDDAHVAFYGFDTFDYICKTFGYERLYDDGGRVMVLRKVAN